MASIDHEQIYFADGEPSMKYVNELYEGWTLPGGYKIVLTRDIEFNMLYLPSGDTVVDLKWQPVEHTEYYEVSYHRMFGGIRSKLSKIIGNLAYKIHTPLIKKKEKTYEEYWAYWEDDHIGIYFYRGRGYNAVFAEGDGFSVVALGGYGHHCNPYTHFINRGYGEEFEKKMLVECYDWLINELLEEGVREIFEYHGNIEKDFKRIWEDLDDITYIDDIKKRFKYISCHSVEWRSKSDYVTYEPYYLGGKRREECYGTES